MRLYIPSPCGSCARLLHLRLAAARRVKKQQSDVVQGVICFATDVATWSCGIYWPISPSLRLARSLLGAAASEDMCSPGSAAEVTYTKLPHEVSSVASYDLSAVIESCASAGSSDDEALVNSIVTHH